MYGWLQLAAANTSEELAIKRYTTQPLQHYRQQTGNSRIECSALCKADMNNQCTGFSFNSRTCFLFNALCASSLTDGNMNGEEVFVFQGMWSDRAPVNCHSASTQVKGNIVVLKFSFYSSQGDIVAQSLNFLMTKIRDSLANTMLVI